MNLSKARPRPGSLNQRMLALIDRRGVACGDEIATALKIPMSHVTASMRRYVVVGLISGKKIKTRGGGVVMEYRPKNKQPDAQDPVAQALRAFADLLVAAAEKIESKP